MKRPLPAGPMVQLATRIPKALHREMKVHITQTDQTVMDFVEKALKALLERERGKAAA